jgi:hypothetical protein
MGERRVMQKALFYRFSLERHVPSDHMLCKIDRFVDLSGIRPHLEHHYSKVGRPSIDPELMIRMLLVGYCYGIRSERRLCDELHLNLAYHLYICPTGKQLRKHRRPFAVPRSGVTKDNTVLYRASQRELRRLRAESQVLPEHAGAQGSALHPRSRPRQGPRHRPDRGLPRLMSRAKEGRGCWSPNFKRILGLDRLRESYQWHYAEPTSDKGFSFRSQQNSSD